MKMIKSHIRFWLGVQLGMVILSFLGSQVLFAQEDTLDLGNVISIGDRNLDLKRSYKLSVSAEFADTSIKELKPGFTFQNFQTKPDFTTNEIKPVRLRIVDPLEKYYPHYARFSFGLYTNSQLLYSFSSLRSKKWNYGISGEWNRGNGGIKNVASSAWRDASIRTWGNLMLSKNRQLGVRLSYLSPMVHLYGGTLDAPENCSNCEEVVRQNIQQIGGEFSFESKPMPKKDFAGSISVAGSYLNYGYDATEEAHFNAIANGTKLFSDRLSVSTRFWIDYNEAIGVKRPIFTTIDNVLGPTLVQKNTLMALDAYASTEFLGIEGDFGLSFNSDAGKLYVYPIVNLSYVLDSKTDFLSLHLNGGLRRNNLHRFVGLNPFLDSYVDLQSTLEKLNLKIGYRGTKLVWRYGIHYRFSVHDRNPLFVNLLHAFEYGKVFSVLYDQISTHTLAVNVSYNKNKVGIDLQGEWNNYSAKEQVFAWHLPVWRFTVSADYNLIEKINVGLSVFYVGERKALSAEGLNQATWQNGDYFVDLKDIVDINLRVKYLYTRRLNAFIEINNLLSQNYQQWYLYDVQPIYIGLGVSAQF
jgi:hypothetical protein